METELELTLQQALELGLSLVRSDRLDAAEHVYGGVLTHFHDQPDALHYLGLLKHKRGDSDAGLQLIKRSIELAPGYAWMWNNLGNVLIEQQRVDEALEAYQRCIALDPDAADALSNLGALHRKCRRLDDAAQACRRSVELRPDFAIGWFNLARILIERGEIREGLLANSKAIVLAPTHQTGRYQVARALVMLGEVARAAAVYREWLADEPDNPLVLHHLAACAGDNSQRRAPDGYIELVFDNFASRFDAKLAGLGYRAPQLIAELLGRRLPTPARALQVADAGCGTGLCGPLVRAWAARLVGIDLSAGMMRLAQQRAVYDELEKAELVAYLRLHAAQFHLVVSADTLCYFGDLAEFAQAAFNALRQGGQLVFTVEAITGEGVDGYCLQPHGRYAHARGYLCSVLTDAGFAIEDMDSEILRYESGLPVLGWLVNACRSGKVSYPIAEA